MKPQLAKNLKIAAGTVGFSILVVALLGVSIIAIPILAVIFIIFMTYLIIRILNEDIDVD
jgi:hypothetical protein|tara:strand:+ start:1039 stop:1218 length:180 start_codon:yes stop_codon:yes gene_type:complete